MDSNTEGSEVENTIHHTSPSQGSESKRSCTDCHTTRTPCWRSGPAGPRSLCNACGIRYRKRRRAELLGPKEGVEKTKRKGSKGESSSKIGVSLGLGLMAFGREKLMQEEWKRKLGEEEQAAFLLMALSCGSVYA